VLRFPLLQRNKYPKRVDTERDDDEKPPFDPQSKKADCGSGEFKPPAVNDRMLDLPPINHRIGPR